MQDTLLGVVVTVLAGIVMGTSPWPLKLMRRFQYEHFAFPSMLVSLTLIPWTITLVLCPSPWAALAQVPVAVLVKANVLSLAWGIAQVLALLCFMRIGVSLTYGILCAVGASVGVVTPMIFKASGAFADAPDLVSPSGLTVLGGVAIMVVGVFFASLAGYGREQMQKADNNISHKTGGFTVGLVMVLVAGVLSAGWGFAFAYSQGPIVEAMKSYGASDIGASIAVWAVALQGAALANILYPVYLMTKKRSWHVLHGNPKEMSLALLYGLLFFIPSILLGRGMVLLGPLGASVGFGIVQGTLILGGQALGFITGEWHGVTGKSRLQIYIAIAILLVSMFIMAVGNALAT